MQCYEYSIYIYQPTVCRAWEHVGAADNGKQQSVPMNRPRSESYIDKIAFIYIEQMMGLKRYWAVPLSSLVEQNEMGSNDTFLLPHCVQAPHCRGKAEKGELIHCVPGSRFIEDTMVSSSVLQVLFRYTLNLCYLRWFQRQQGGHGRECTRRRERQGHSTCNTGRRGRRPLRIPSAGGRKRRRGSTSTKRPFTWLRRASSRQTRCHCNTT